LILFFMNFVKVKKSLTNFKSVIAFFLKTDGVFLNVDDARYVPSTVRFNTPAGSVILPLPARPAGWCWYKCGALAGGFRGSGSS